MGKKEVTIERTIIRNYPGDEDYEPEQNWRVTVLRKVQLKCPKCFRWFTLPKSDFKIDSEGNVDSIVYHVCDNGDKDDDTGWVVLPTLDGWRS